ncbi:MAG: hypothetical protein GY938_12155 [Ketobacter sp.]|nr:hypothetical protein [Ketobacter sp.]
MLDKRLARGSFIPAVVVGKELHEASNTVGKTASEHDAPHPNHSVDAGSNTEKGKKLGDEGDAEQGQVGVILGKVADFEPVGASTGKEGCVVA